MLRSRKAQAVLELAILGSLIIMAFAILIGFSEKYNREQSYLQQTFRETLSAAKSVNNSASLSTVDFRRMPNVTNPVEIGELQQFSSSNNVLWSDGKTGKKDDKDAQDTLLSNLNQQYDSKGCPRTQAGDPTSGGGAECDSLRKRISFYTNHQVKGIGSKAVSLFELNRESVVNVPIKKGAGPYNTTTYSTNWYSSSLKSDNDFNKSEDSNITTSKSLGARDEITGVTDVGDTKVSFETSYLYGDEKSGGTYKSKDDGLNRSTELK